MINTLAKIQKVAVYCRLSKDDGTQSESASISTQKEILSQYVKQQGWQLVKTYIDDGFSGINFNRPEFKKMIKDIEDGLIDCVITKDLSRLGRNYLDCGLYLEVFFPEHKVRYIAVNDGVDTLNKTAMDITPFRNILNEMYSADVSVKIKSAKRARFNQGKFMGATPPYGYLKDPIDHNHLVIDERTSSVVKKMFELAKEGNGISRIRKYLNSQHILRPAAMAIENGWNYDRFFENNDENRYIWSENSVRGILRSPVYAGHISGYKRPALSMKSRKRPSRKPEDWEFVKDTHEAIVSQEDFDLVQRLMTSRRRGNDSGFDNIFAGIIKCVDCGYAMRAGGAHRKKHPDIIDCVQYWCNNYGRYGNVNCTSHTIEARDLINAVLTDINRYVDLAINDDEAVKILQQKLSTIGTNEAKSFEKEKRRLDKRIEYLDKLFSALYEDKVMNKITERNYDLMSAKYEKEQIEIDSRLKIVDAELLIKGKNDTGIVNFLNLIRSYQGITELTASIVNALIDKITISERSKNSDGQLEQTITIYYKFVGSLNDFTLTVPKNNRCTSEKKCANCGVTFISGSNVTKYCPVCSKEIHKQQSNESKQKSRSLSKHQVA